MHASLIRECSDLYLEISSYKLFRPDYCKLNKFFFCAYIVAFYYALINRLCCVSSVEL